MNAFCTVVTESHLVYAKILVETLHQSGNDEPLFVLIPDVVKHEDDREYNFIPIYLSDLSVSYPETMPYYYNPFELCCALKPFIVRYLFDTRLARSVIYLDCDIFVVGKFTQVWEELQSTALMLTPHQLFPPNMDIEYSNELDILKFGLFNGGFYGWHLGDAANKILDWMCERFPRLGFSSPEHAMFVDQNLLTLVLAYFSNDVIISRNLGLNIAYWNAHERNVKIVSDSWMVDSAPVVFFHLSGYRLTFPNLPCSYLSAEANNLLLKNAHWFNEVITRYREILLSHDIETYDKEYFFQRFDDIYLNQEYRRMLFESGKIDRLSCNFLKTKIFNFFKSVILNTKKMFTLR